jgi:hypothetical protein
MIAQQTDQDAREDSQESYEIPKYNKESSSIQGVD